MISNNVFTPDHTFPLSMWPDCNFRLQLLQLYHKTVSQTTKGKILVNNFSLPIIHTVTFRGGLLKNFPFPPSFMPSISFFLTSSLLPSLLPALSSSHSSSSFFFLSPFLFSWFPHFFYRPLLSYSILDTVPSERKLCQSDNNLCPQYAKYLLSHLM